jgi:hypothetical protein
MEIPFAERLAGPEAGLAFPQKGTGARFCGPRSGIFLAK